MPSRNEFEWPKDMTPTLTYLLGLTGAIKGDVHSVELLLPLKTGSVDMCEIRASHGANPCTSSDCD